MPVRQHLARAGRGFTLIELLVVISIIALLAVILVVGAMGLGKKSKIQATQAKLGNLAQALNDYYQAFQAFPPSAYPLPETADQEWWRYLSFSGSAFQRPQKFDGTIVEEPFIAESKLELPRTGTVRLPKDAWGNDILYIYPADNDVANLMACDASGNSSDTSLPVNQLQVAQLYYHCIVLSKGEDKKMTLAPVPGQRLNAGAFEGDADNKDTVQNQLLKTVSGQ